MCPLIGIQFGTESDRGTTALWTKRLRLYCFLHQIRRFHIRKVFRSRNYDLRTLSTHFLQPDNFFNGMEANDHYQHWYANGMGCSQTVPHPSAHHVRFCLDSTIGWKPVYILWALGLNSVTITVESLRNILLVHLEAIEDIVSNFNTTELEVEKKWSKNVPF